MKRLPTNSFINLDELNFDYSFCDKKQRELVMEFVKNKVKTTQEKPNKHQWTDYWKEVFESDSKTPSFFKKKQDVITGKNVFRYKDNFILTKKENLGPEALHEIINNALLTLPKNISAVVEFGCGNGHNLQYIKERHPKLKLAGCDFAKSAVLMVKKNGHESFLFDMKAADSLIPKSIKLDPDNTAFFTSGSMEQLGSDWKIFFDFLVSSAVKYVIHVEPIKELYCKNKDMEKLAIKFHKSKKYLNNYFSHLKKQKTFTVTYSKSNFGTLFDQGFNVLILKRK